MIHVLIADHQELFRIGMAEVLAVAGDVRIVGRPKSPEQLLNTLKEVDVSGEFCTRANVRETGTRGAEAWQGRSTVQNRSSPCCDRSKSNLPTIRASAKPAKRPGSPNRPI